MFGLVPYYPMSLTTAATPEGWIHAQRQASEEAGMAEQRLRAIYGRLSAPNDLRRVDAFEQEVGRLCARRARTADLTVMGWSAGGGGDMERAVFESCLFDSGRPVLLTPTDVDVPRPAAARAGRLERLARGPRAPCARRCRCCARPS